jgi:MFS transporter, Spinster family, sphingosine-1-phosphate transporter
MASMAAPRTSVGGRAAWWALALIVLTQAMSMIDRQILAILLPRIKADLKVGDAEMGLLYGTVFALFYALFSLPLGRLADTWIRGRLLSISIFAWSAMTALGGMASTFGVLAVSRLGVGIGEASVQPAGMSLLSDYFPKERRGLISAAFGAAIALGLGGALWLGGSTADWWDSLYAPGTAPFGFKGWQIAFIVAALPGFFLAILLWLMPEPERGAADGLPPPPAHPHPFRTSFETLGSILPVGNWLYFARMRARPRVWMVNLTALVVILTATVLLTGWTDSLRKIAPPPLRLGGLTITGNALQWIVIGFGVYVMVNWLQGLRLRDAPAHALIARSPALGLLFLLAALQSVVNYGVMGWTPAFLIQTFSSSPADVGFKFGALSGGIGIIGPLIAGPVADRFARLRVGGRFLVTLFALGVSPFLAFWTYGAPTIGDFYFRFIFYALVLTMWIPAVYAGFMDLALPRMRGAVMSFYLLTMTITGLGVGPYAVGLISDVNGGDLGSAILSVYWLGVPIVLIIVALLFLLPRDEALVTERARAAGEPI